MFNLNLQNSNALADLHEQVNALFDAVIGGPASRLDGWDQTRYPAVNIWEDDNAAHIEIPVPGATPKDLDVSVTGNQVRISFERTMDEPKRARRHRAERVTGKFIRRFTLPWEPDSQNVQASLKDGLLALQVPRAQSSRPRKIKLLHA